MALRIKATPLSILFLLITAFLLSSSIVEGLDKKAKPCVYVRKDGIKVNYWRKILGHDEILDYDYAGPNPKHDPKKGKPGKGP